MEDAPLYGKGARAGDLTEEERAVLRDCADRMARVLEDSRARAEAGARELEERALETLHKQARNPTVARLKRRRPLKRQNFRGSR